MSLRQKMTTLRMNRLINEKVITKQYLSSELGMARVTLNTRLKKGNWKLTEMISIDAIM